MTSQPWTPAAESLTADLKHVFGSRLEALVAYGPLLEGVAEAPLTCLALVSTLTAEDLAAAARHANRWRRAGIGTPLMLSTSEFMRSLDVFPLEYGEIIRAHVLVFGTDPFADASIAPDDLRRACELQAKSHLVHLREAYIESGGHPSEVSDLVRGSAPAFTALLRNVARLNGVTTDGRDEATRAGAKSVGIPEALVTDMLTMERSTMTTPNLSQLFPEYLAAAEQLAHAVDRWRVS